MSESPFLNPIEYGERTAAWRQASQREGEMMKREHGLVYTMNRCSGAKFDNEDLDRIHQINFIKFVSGKIDGNHSSRKNPTMVLDLGGGMHFFSDQLRENFGSKVRVISTDISRDVVEQARSMLVEMQAQIPYIGKVKKTLHPDDGKMHSIFQMNAIDENGRPKSEFDLIVDTYGEQYYGLDGSEEMLKKYLQAVVAKLKSGGMATIYPFGKFGVHSRNQIKEFLFPLAQIRSLKEELTQVCVWEEKIRRDNQNSSLRLIKK